MYRLLKVIIIPLTGILFLLGSHKSLAQVDSIALSREYYNMGMEIFDYTHRKQAAELFEQSVAYNPKDAEANLMAGRSIMLSINKPAALPYFQAANKLDPSVHVDLLFFLGQAHHYSSNLDSALHYYNAFYRHISRSLDIRKADKIHEVNRKMFECRNAKIYMANPVDVKFNHLSRNVNSEWPDYAPSVTADGSLMVFTSRRPDDNLNPSLADDYQYFEDIYYSEYKDGEWEYSLNIGPPLNTFYHNSNITISPDGKEMYVYSDGNGGDILVSKSSGPGIWSKPEPLNGINSTYLESSVSVTADGKYMYFTSNRPGGYGGTDIYVATKNRSGNWTGIKNLENLVNTEFDEESVFVVPAGNELYFSSNGHAGMGDLDIYKTVFDSASMSWGPPVNLGFPINSVENDMHFVLTGDGRYAYMSSVRKNFSGIEDIFMIDMKTWKPVDQEAEDFVDPFVAGPTPGKGKNGFMEFCLIDGETNRPVIGKANLYDTHGSLYPLKSAGMNSYRINFKNQPVKTNGGKLTVIFTADGYQEKEVVVYGFHNSIEVKDSIFMVKEIKPKQTVAAVYATQKPFEVKAIDIHFPHDSDEPYSFLGAENLLALMNQDMSLYLELAGHTDNTGDENYNLSLSQKRAEAISKYLIAAGVSSDRIIAKGYGQKEPLLDSDTKDARRLNRRVEYRLYKP